MRVVVGLVRGGGRVSGRWLVSGVSKATRGVAALCRSQHAGALTGDACCTHLLLPLLVCRCLGGPVGQHAAGEWTPAQPAASANCYCCHCCYQVCVSVCVCVVSTHAQLLL